MLILGSGCNQVLAIADISKTALNYGVVFKHHHSISITEGMWRITFSRKLPSLDMMIDDKTKLHANTSFYTGAKFAALSNCALPSRVAGAHAPKGINCAKFVDNAAFLKELGIRAHRTLLTISENIKNSLPHQLPRNWHNKRVISTRALLYFVADLGKSIFGFATSQDTESIRTAVNEL